MDKDQGREPQTPHDNLLYCLYVQYAKDEDELIEDEVPKLVLQVLWNKHGSNKTRLWLFNTQMEPHRRLLKKSMCVYSSQTHLLLADSKWAKHHILNHFSDQHQGAAECVD